MKILVVEDNLKIRKNIIDFFKIQGHLAEGAENGYDALTMLHAMYDIVILDINMPKMNGKEFLEKMRTTEKNVPVIALTSNSTIENKAEIFELGADDYLNSKCEFWLCIDENERLSKQKFGSRIVFCIQKNIRSRKMEKISSSLPRNI